MCNGALLCKQTRKESKACCACSVPASFLLATERKGNWSVLAVSSKERKREFLPLSKWWFSEVKSCFTSCNVVNFVRIVSSRLYPLLPHCFYPTVKEVRGCSKEEGLKEVCSLSPTPLLSIKGKLDSRQFGSVVLIHSHFLYWKWVLYID